MQLVYLYIFKKVFCDSDQPANIKVKIYCVERDPYTNDFLKYHIHPNIVSSDSIHVENYVFGNVIEYIIIIMNNNVFFKPVFYICIFRLKPICIHRIKKSEILNRLEMLKQSNTDPFEGFCTGICKNKKDADLIFFMYISWS